MVINLVLSILKQMGYELRRIEKTGQGHKFPTDIDRKLGYYLEEEANLYIKMVRAYTMLPYIRLVTLYQQAVHCERFSIGGGFVECGVWKGGSVALMAFANLHYGEERRHIHLFDAFDDICEPDSAIDGQRALNEARAYVETNAEMRGRLKPLKGIYDAFGGCGTLEENRRLLEKVINYDPTYLHYHKGWFQDTLPKEHSQIEQIAILRLDADWYASTKICLEYLYDKVVSGGFIIVDDYGHYEGCRKAVDEFIGQRGLTVFLSQVDYTCVYWIKP